MRRAWWVVAVVVPVLVSSCSASVPSGDPPRTTATSSETSSATSPAPAGIRETAPPAAEEIVHDPEASLQMLALARDGHEMAVRSAWAVWRGPQDRRPWMAATWSDDRFRTSGYLRGGWTRLHAVVHGPRPPGTRRFDTCGSTGANHIFCVDYRVGQRPRARWTVDGGETWSSTTLLDLRALLPSVADSLAPSTWTIVGGGDGATLFPFERVVRSTNDGATWETVELPLFDGERAYAQGEVVLPDGRLLVVLGQFSDDGRNDPADRHHGLWVSEGDDWSEYRPFRVRLAQDQEPSPEGWATIDSVSASADPDPVLWVTTWDGRVYASTDSGRHFREVRTR